MALLLKPKIVFLACLMSFAAARLRNSTEQTEVLQSLLKNYDKRIIPSRNGDPIDVKIQVYILDMVPVKSYHMHYSMNIFFREIWKDYRLVLPLNGSDYMVMASEALESFWIPEANFPTAKRGKLHNVRKPNVGIHLHKGGEIFLSRRVALTFFCPMDLHNFPFDQQICHVPIQLFAYNKRQCRLNWGFQNDGPIYIQKDLQVLEFALKNYTFGKKTVSYPRAGHFDSLWIRFVLKRDTKFYVLQYLTPCALIVILSWVGFWINYASTPARASLGITTVLTITTLTNSIRASLPNVAYTKAIDVYLLGCFVFVFASTIEFAIVGVFHRKWEKAYKKTKMRKEREESGRGSSKTRNSFNKELGSDGSISEMNTNQGFELNENVQDNEATLSNVPLDLCNITARNNTSFRKEHINIESKEVETKKKYDMQENYAGAQLRQRDTAISKRWRQYNDKIAENHMKDPSEHIIDRRSRFIFPILFLIFNIGFFVVII